MLEALGQAQIQPFVLVLKHNTTCSTDKTSGMCLLFLQSTPQQNWILLSVYHSRSGNLHAAVTTQYRTIVSTDYNVIIPLNIGYIKLYTTIHDTNNAKMYKELK